MGRVDDSKRFSQGDATCRFCTLKLQVWNQGSLERQGKQEMNALFGLSELKAHDLHAGRSKYWAAGCRRALGEARRHAAATGWQPPVARSSDSCSFGRRLLHTQVKWRRRRLNLIPCAGSLRLEAQKLTCQWVSSDAWLTGPPTISAICRRGDRLIEYLLEVGPGT